MNRLLKIPKTKLDDFLAQVNVKDQIRSGNLEAVLNTMQVEYGLLSDVEDDKETTALMDIWSTSDVTQSDEVFQQWDQEKATRELDLEQEL